MPLGFVTGPDDLLVDDERHAAAHRQGLFVGGAARLHGLMHTVIGNAAKGDPVPHRHAVPLHGQHGLELVDEHGWHHRHADGEGRGRRLQDPVHHLFRRLFVETVPYADLVLPDTTYLERHDCISLLDRPISHADGPGDAIRQPVMEPDRDVRPFQTVLIELGARLGLPGLREGGRQSPKFRDYADYIVNHERTPGIGPLAGWRGGEDEREGRGEPNQDQLQRYIENGGFWRHNLAPNESLLQARQPRLSRRRPRRWGCIGRRNQIVLQIWSEPLQKFRLAAEGHGAKQPPETLRERVRTYCDPLPFWYAPLEQQQHDTDVSLVTPSRSGRWHMYHSWGSMNAWLRQIHGSNKLYMSRATRHGRRARAG
jgi:anaerobic selenocysteine-containing dehydrogenase